LFLPKRPAGWGPSMLQTTGIRFDYLWSRCNIYIRLTTMKRRVHAIIREYTILAIN
jgi:hypothetical protein